MINKIKRIVEKHPNRIAYKVNNECITYKDIWNRAGDYAQLLKKQGTKPVIIYGHKNISVVISILSCLIANRTYVPVDSCIPLYRVKQIVEMTGSSLVLTENNIEIDNIESSDLEGLKKYKNFDIREQNNEIVYIIFTSGSTGIPKGVPISKTNLNNFIEWISSLKPLCDYKNVNVFNQASFSFDLSVADLYYSLCNGHTLIALDSGMQDGYDEIFSLMSEIDVAVMTPTFMKLCLINKEFNEKNYPGFKCVYFCGEQLEVKTVQKLFQAFPDLKIINAYGPTEATSAVSAILITKEMAYEQQLLPVGEVKTFATEIEIIDDEIVLKGKSVFSGYLLNIIGGHYIENDTDCYKTGDIGFIQDGKLYCRGRKDRQVKFKGYRIELNDIEHNIGLIRGVKECAVVAKYSDALAVKSIIAFVTAEDGIDASYIKTESEKFIPRYMVPKTIKIIEKLPINQNGKIDRKALSEL
ncbi:MAG: AMP-binding protein [Oscillospiraceae bacterium]|nr:AMP-binding protein [Oscillospiraceae bacterium]